MNIVDILETGSDEMDFEELLAEMEKENSKKNFRNWINNKFPEGYGGYNIYYLLTHPHKILEEFALQIKWAYQRVFRGWDDRACWDIDSYLAKILPQLLRNLKEKSIGVSFDEYFFKDAAYTPDGGFDNETIERARQERNKMLDNIIAGFEMYYDRKDTLTTEEYNIFSESFDLLKKYFNTLWW